MLSNGNPSINNPQNLAVEQNSKLSVPVTSVQPSQRMRPIPKSLLVLLLCLILQLGLGIAILVLKVVLGYRGFDGVYPMAIDPLQCSDTVMLYKYYGSELKILSITLVMISVCVLLTIILIILTIISISRSKNLPYSTLPSSPLQTLTMVTLYRVVGHGTRVAMYVLQSICLMCIIVVLGYYLSYYINIPASSCVWSTYDNIYVMVLWILAGVLLVVGWVVWVIIVMINVKNNRQQVYRYEHGEQLRQQDTKPIQNTYNTINNNTYNTLNTQPNTNNNRNTQPQPNTINNTYKYSDPLLKKQTTPNNTQSIQMGNNVGRYLQPNSYITSNIKQQNKTPINIITNSNVSGYNNSSMPNTSKNNIQDNYQNPMFKSRRQLYQSPYKRIQNGRYYQGSRQAQLDKQRDRNNREIKRQQIIIQDKDKDKEFKRSRFNTNPNDYNTGATQEDQYLKTLTRYRIEHQRESPNRPIYPQAKHTNSPGGNLLYEGGTKARMHSTYFKGDQSLMIKKKYDNSDEKKKRKGILNDYIRSRYADG